MRPFIAGALDIASKITRQLNRCGHVMFSYSTLKTSLVTQTVKGLPTMWETWVQSLGGKDLLKKGMATHSSILASPAPHPEKGSRKYWASLVAQTVMKLPTMQETQLLSLGQKDPLEKGMATHSSILSWIIQRTEL